MNTELKQVIDELGVNISNTLDGKDLLKYGRIVSALISGSNSENIHLNHDEPNVCDAIELSEEQFTDTLRALFHSSQGIPVFTKKVQLILHNPLYLKACAVVVASAADNSGSCKTFIDRLAAFMNN